MADVVIGVSGDAPSTSHLYEFFEKSHSKCSAVLEFIIDPNNHFPILRRKAENYIFEMRICSLDLTRKALMFVASQLSKTYLFVHGCGFVYEGRGVLLLGGRGAGKSTLLRMLGAVDIVDEDCLFIKHGQMHTGTIQNIRYTQVGGKKFIAFADTKTDWITIDVIAVLDKKYKGGYWSLLDNCLDEKKTMPDFFSIDQKKITPNRRIIVGCPAYQIGTAGNIDTTISVLQRLIQN